MRDRTGEFFSTVQSFQKQRGDPLQSSGRPSCPLSWDGENELIAAANQIKLSLDGAQQILERLSELINSSGLFQDPAVAISDHSATLQQQLKQAAADVDLLAALSKECRGSAARIDSANNVVNSLRQELAQKTRALSDLLQMRARKVKQQSHRRLEFEGGPVSVVRRRPNAMASLVGEPDLCNSSASLSSFPEAGELEREPRQNQSQTQTRCV
jgi:hypothetical protein